ncbi:glycosyltransferase family 4 protein [Sphingomonas sp. NFR15]|uniref:glycosyltransferase family 4 protein n=1 Tax=Sphingomonas sp. NFR15 TaxID=1566282 RepID=UPI00210EB13B|nr:glycosyltransferase family 4 protein [Sphingomonas sp. NFR15]
MKILHVAQKTKGGVATHMAQLVAAQAAEHGASNVVIVVGDDEKHFFDTIPQSTLRLFRSSARRPGAFASMARFAHRTIAAERPDILHIHSTFAGVLIRARYLFTRAEQRPAIVYCAHGWAFNMQIPAWQKRIYIAIERLLARATDRILCISRFEQDSAIAVGLPPAKLEMVYNGLPPLDRDIAPAAGFDPATLNLLFIGRTTPQKGLPDLLAAMALLRERPIHLHTVGDRMDEAQPAPANVTEHGWKPREVLPDYIAAADAIVMPSRWEGFGLVAIEAMRQARPVVASDADALPEIVRPGISGYLYPRGDVPALAEVLAGLDRDTLRALGRSGRDLFLEMFTEDRMIAKVGYLYRRLAGDRASEHR